MMVYHLKVLFCLWISKVAAGFAPPRHCLTGCGIRSGTNRQHQQQQHHQQHEASARGTPLPMVKYEELLEKIPAENVIDAIEKAPGGKVVISDVAASAGVSLSQARRDVTTLASLTQANLAVSNDGDLIYTFPSSVRGTLSANSAKYKALQTFNKAKPILFYLLRVSFGVVLLASLAAIFTSILIISSSSSSSDDDDRGFGDRRGGGGGGGLFTPSYMWGPSPFDFFYYRPYYGYYATDQASSSSINSEDMGFLESIFSYLFGDGNPNARLEEERLTLVANMIRRNNGAVTAEQLAPFCDEGLPEDPFELDDEDNVNVNESFVLPLVTKLDGQPRVTDDGDIIYVFPELQLSASGAESESPADVLARAGLSPEATAGEIKTLLRLNNISTAGALEKADLINILSSKLPKNTKKKGRKGSDESSSLLLEEDTYKFSLASGFNKVLAAALGVINLGGALYLGNLFAQYALYDVRLPSFLGTVQAFYPALVTYAVLFNAIPAVRALWIKQQNAKIRQRNQKRRLWKTALDAGGRRVRRKLESAKKFGTKIKQLGASSSSVYYDTSKTLNEQERKRQVEFLEEFDRLLEE